MTIYDFMASKEECHKLTSQRFNAVTLVNAFSMLEDFGDRAVEVRMHQKMFCQFVCNAFDNKMENTVYERSVRTMKFMNADMVIDNSLDENIIVVHGRKDDGMSVVKIYIGKAC
jgi:hypothetical protein